MLADILKENNVNNEGMRFDPGARTALAFVTLRGDGEREFMFYRNPSADMLLQEAELDFNLIRKVSESCYYIKINIRYTINLIIERTNIIYIL
jgi:fructokinase